MINKELRVFEAFSGYGSQALALEYIKRDYNLNFRIVGISEIDEYAIKGYTAMHGETKNFGDISKLDYNEIEDFDLFTYSFPCTNISNSGKQEGFEKNSGTASSLLWECERAILAKKPKYLLMENVKALLSNKFKSLFNEWCNLLESYGYTNYYQILNAEDYGEAQHRERVIMVSILNDDEGFTFPKPIEKKTYIKDILESNVIEKYYLSEVIQNRFVSNDNNKNIIGTTKPNVKTNGQRVVVYNTNGIMGALVATDYKQPRQILNPIYINERPQKHIRKLTPKECFRLMGVEDNEIEKILNWKDDKGEKISNMRLYKMCGNSICVKVLYHVFKSLFIK